MRHATRYGLPKGDRLAVMASQALRSTSWPSSSIPSSDCGGHGGDIVAARPPRFDLHLPRRGAGPSRRVGPPARRARRSRVGELRTHPEGSRRMPGADPVDRRGIVARLRRRHRLAAAAGPRYGELSASSQDGVRGSTLEMYRQALKIRRQRLTKDEDLEWIKSERNVLAFRRGSGVACMVNFGKQPVALPPAASLASQPGVTTELPADTTVSDPARLTTSPQPRRHASPPSSSASNKRASAPADERRTDEGSSARARTAQMLAAVIDTSTRQIATRRPIEGVEATAGTGDRDHAQGDDESPQQARIEAVHRTHDPIEDRAARSPPTRSWRPTVLRRAWRRPPVSGRASTWRARSPMPTDRRVSRT